MQGKSMELISLRDSRRGTSRLRGFANSHGARDQVTVSTQPEAGRPDLGLKLADDANAGRPCGAVAE